MLRLTLTEMMWRKINSILNSLNFDKFNIRLYCGNTRKFIEAVLWKLRTGAPWRDLPSEFGSYSTIFNRFNRWSKIGLWAEVFKTIRNDIDNEWNFMDSTIIKAHQHSLGYSLHSKECIGKSVAGNSTKIHMISDSLGNPVAFILSEGQVHDSKFAKQLIQLSDGENFIADKAYDSKEIRNMILDKGAHTIIPKKINAVDKTNIGFDKFLYKFRHLAENLFAKIKHYRSIATRYEKTAINFASLIFIACIIIWSKF